MNEGYTETEQVNENEKETETKGYLKLKRPVLYIIVTSSLHTTKLMRW